MNAVIIVAINLAVLIAGYFLFKHKLNSKIKENEEYKNRLKDDREIFMNLYYKERKLSIEYINLVYSCKSMLKNFYDDYLLEADKNQALNGINTFDNELKKYFKCNPDSFYQITRFDDTKFQNNFKDK